MSAAEIVWRARDAARREAWVFRQVRPGTQSFPFRSPRHSRFAPVLPPGTRDAVPREIRDSLVEAANGVLAGQWKVLGVLRTDLRAPDWFRDPITGLRAPQDKYAFRVNHRSEAETGNVKQIWELSRHQHLTILAAGWFVTGDDDYAEAVAGQLRSWWSENTFLSGINWTSGIELGLRLVAWVWIRRLLDGWPGVTSLFEDNGVAMSQVFWHQRYLAAFRSRGSSANNHVIAEAAGQLAASCAFPWFAESGRWRSEATRLLERELCANTFPSGLDREQAFDYHGFVAELGVLAAVEADVFGQPLSDDTWRRLCRMIDAAASVVDESQRAPRQGDSDEGRALVVDAPDVSRWTSLLSTGAALFDPAPWWPKTTPSTMSVLLGALSSRRPVASGRPGRRSSQFPDAGLALLRTDPDERPEIWCRCDGGPHGYLTIAGHAHADALSVEVRYGGVDVLADPGTYCYHGEPEWRRYFRSTLAHNTVELAGQDQSLSGGPFLWLRHARTVIVDVRHDDEGAVTEWSAEHDGYQALDPPARHRRTIRLDHGERRIDIADRIDTVGRHVLRMAFHLGPTVHAEVEDLTANLSWPTIDGYESAVLALPRGLQWSVHCGETAPVLGWYSSAFGTKVPTTAFVGEGRCDTAVVDLHTSIRFSS
jgi:hypothetical protein